MSFSGLNSNQIKASMSHQTCNICSYIDGNHCGIRFVVEMTFSWTTTRLSEPNSNVHEFYTYKKKLNICATCPSHLLKGQLNIKWFLVIPTEWTSSCATKLLHWLTYFTSFEIHSFFVLHFSPINFSVLAVTIGHQADRGFVVGKTNSNLWRNSIGMRNSVEWMPIDM